MIPRLKPTLGARELAAILSPHGSDAVARFENAFAELMGQKHAVAFPYGRTGLLILIEALGLKDQEIICPAYTCVVVPHAIVLSGNEPVFLDSSEDGFNMNLDLVAEAVTEKTGAVVATSIFGYPVDLDKLDAVKRQFPDLIVIQDCAHSFAARWKDRPVHAEGAAAIFGLNVSKTITSIFGGMATTDNDELAERLRRLRDERLTRPTWKKALLRRLYLAAVYPAFWGPVYGAVNRLERSAFLDRFVKYYDETAIDMPGDHLTGMTGVEAAVGLAQISRYGEIVGRRVGNVKIYDRELRGISGFDLPPLVEGATFSHYVARTPFRNELLDSALKKGLQLGQLIEYSVPEMASYRDRPGNRFPCPVAGRLAKETVNLPVWIDSPAAREKVIRTVRTFFAQKAGRSVEKASAAPATASSSQKQDFDNHWETNALETIAESKLRAAREFLTPLRDSLRNNEALSILDAGCGDGVHAHVLFDSNSNNRDSAPRIGVDLARDALLKARSRADIGWRFIRADVGGLPFEDRTFDAVFSYGVLAYTDDPALSFSELCRVVKPGGLVGVWLYPKARGLGGALFRTVRAVCRWGGPFVTRAVADCIVPFLSLLPTSSGLTLGNASWKQCREIVLVNIAPRQLIFPEREEVVQWFEDNHIDPESETLEAPITVWGVKRPKQEVD